MSDSKGSRVRICSGLGLLLSIYALFVEFRLEQNENYSALCDISQHISCSKAFSSKYGKGFGMVASIFGEDSILNQPNTVPGIIFYVSIIFLSFFESKAARRVQVVLCVFANLMSIYLGYVLYFVLEDLCVVCVATYLVNAGCLWLSTSRLHLSQNKSKKLS